MFASMEECITVINVHNLQMSLMVLLLNLPNSQYTKNVNQHSLQHLLLVSHYIRMNKRVMTFAEWRCICKLKTQLALL